MGADARSMLTTAEEVGLPSTSFLAPVSGFLCLTLFFFFFLLSLHIDLSASQCSQWCIAVRVYVFSEPA